MLEKGNLREFQRRKQNSRGATLGLEQFMLDLRNDRTVQSGSSGQRTELGRFCQPLNLGHASAQTKEFFAAILRESVWFKDGKEKGKVYGR